MSSMREVYMDYYPMLIKVIPMDDVLFVAQLYAGQLLPGDAKDVIKSRPTRTEKAQYFLDNFIDKGFADDGSNNLFLALLDIMESSESSTLELLAEEIKWRIQGIVLLVSVFVDMIFLHILHSTKL